MLELHIWGPSFGLPSIDPECLAAIAYFRCISALNGPPQWRIVPSSNPMLSPDQRIEINMQETALTIQRSGGAAMVIIQERYQRYEMDICGSEEASRGSLNTCAKKAVQNPREGGYEPRDGQDEEKVESDEEDRKSHRATYTWSESVAYTSLIRARLGVLLDISLYVSQVNYERATRPEYSKRGMLPWPVQYYVPGQKRSQAWMRCEEVLRKYGLSAWDVDPSPILQASGGRVGDEANLAGGGVGVGIGMGAGMGATGVAGVQAGIGVYGKSSSASTAGVVFKLQTLISKSLTPVAARLVAIDADPRDGVYFFRRSTPTSIDCLILGYLCLSIYPELPNPFLAEGIRELDGGRDGKRVYDWVEAFGKKVFGAVPVNGYMILNSNTEDGFGSTPLPWGKVERADLPWLTGYFFTEARIYFKTLVPEWGKRQERNKRRAETAEENERMQRAIKRDKLERLATVVLGVGAFVGFLFAAGISFHTVEEEEEQEEEDLGDKNEMVVVNADELDAKNDLRVYAEQMASGDGKGGGNSEGQEQPNEEQETRPE
ncbi:hypothetical protein BDZ91DRAFT_760198 [Kalaharituber pfeilii]|nr:hypothetical protein BDZ91DRAFT_760198 [Kalaharituber pfeilii]